MVINTEGHYVVTMDCPKCKKALCDRIQQNFQDRLLRKREHSLLWRSTANDILERVIKEELAK